MPEPWIEAWALPGVGTFEKKVGPIPYTSLSYADELGRVGSGLFTISSDYDRLDEIIDPLNNLETLIRVWEDGVNTFSFFARSVDKDYSQEGTIAISGPGIADALDKILSYPNDWAGTDIIPASGTTNQMLIPDIVYGGPNILANPGFEQGLLNEKQQIYHNYSGSTLLNGAINDTQTTATVDDGSVWPTSNFLIVIGSEKILVGSRTGNSLSSMQRGYLSTTASSHADNSEVDGGGAFTLTYSGQTTGNIWWNAPGSGLGSIEDALEGLNNIIDVSVLGSGVLGDPWLVEFIEPGEVDNPLLTYTSVNLTNGDTFSISEAQLGGQGDPAPWTKSYNPNTQEFHGGYDAFNVGSASKFGDPAHTGDGALGINPDLDATPVDNYPGGQQIVPVTQGQLYQCSAWVYGGANPISVSLVIRDLYENEIAKVTQSIPATTWTQLTLDNVPIQNYRKQAIFRVAVNNPGEFDTLWIDDCEMNEGLQPSSPGQIVLNLWTYATAETRDGADWLKHDSFTGTLDSGGNAWGNDLSLGIIRGQSWLQVLEQLSGLGVEWKIDWNAGSNSYELRLYEQGNLGSVLSGNNDPKISSSNITQAVVRKSSPEANIALVEGANLIVDEISDTALVTAYGRRESYIGNQEALDLATINRIGDHKIDIEKNRKVGVAVAVEPNIVFGRTKDADLGDTINVFLPPDVPQSGYRIYKWNVVVSTNGQITKRVEVGKFVPFERIGGTTSTVTSNAVNYLLRQFKKLDRVTGAVSELANLTPQFFGGGLSGAIIMVAASDASTASKDAATLICDGTNDEVEIQAALDALSDYGGTVWLSEGNFSIEGNISFPDTDTTTDRAGDINLYGWGSRLDITQPTVNASVFSTAGDWQQRRQLNVQGITFYQSSPTNPATVRWNLFNLESGFLHISNCTFRDLYLENVFGGGTLTYFGHYMISDCNFDTIRFTSTGNSGDHGAIMKAEGTASRTQRHVMTNCRIHNLDKIASMAGAAHIGEASGYPNVILINNCYITSYGSSMSAMAGGSNTFISHTTVTDDNSGLGPGGATSYYLAGHHENLNNLSGIVGRSFTTFTEAGLVTVAASDTQYVFMRDGTIYNTKLRARVGPTSTPLIADVHVNGTTIYGTATNPQIAAGAQTSVDAAPDNGAVAVTAGDWMDVHVDDKGGGAAEDLTITVEWEVEV